MRAGKSGTRARDDVKHSVFSRARRDTTPIKLAMWGCRLSDETRHRERKREEIEIRIHIYPDPFWRSYAAITIKPHSAAAVTAGSMQFAPVTSHILDSNANCKWPPEWASQEAACGAYIHERCKCDALPGKKDHTTHELATVIGLPGVYFEIISPSQRYI